MATTRDPDPSGQSPAQSQPAPDLEPFDIPEAMRIAEALARHELAKRGQAFGFAALVTMLGAVIWLALIDQPWVAGVIGGGGLAVVVGVFVTGKYQSATVKVPDVTPREIQAPSPLVPQQRVNVPIPRQERPPSGEAA